MGCIDGTDIVMTRRNYSKILSQQGKGVIAIQGLFCIQYATNQVQQWLISRAQLLATLSHGACDALIIYHLKCSHHGCTQFIPSF